MPKNSFLIALFLFLVNLASAQSTVPVIRAKSDQIHIRDGAFLLEGRLNPKLKPDRYDALRSRAEKKVVFYTDVDSIAVTVKPGSSFDFVVLHDRDSCFQRISGNARSYTKACAGCVIDQDTIPFTFGKGNKIHLQGSINGSQLLDLMFDTGASTTVLYPSAKEKGVKLAFDGTTENAGVGGSSTRQTSSRNKIQIGQLIWERESVLFVEQQADKADGIIGFNLFSDKILEIDYDHKRIIVHDRPFTVEPGYSKLKLSYSGYLARFPATVMKGSTPQTALFVFDSGSDGSIGLDPAFAKRNGLPGDMEELGTSTSHGVGSGSFQNKIVLLPELKIGNSLLTHVPMTVPMPEGNEFTSDNVFGMDVMRRFNTIIDYQQNWLYLKPNSLIGEPYRKPVNKTWIIAGVIVIVLLLLGTIIYFRKNSKKQPRLS